MYIQSTIVSKHLALSIFKIDQLKQKLWPFHVSFFRHHSININDKKILHLPCHTITKKNGKYNQ